MAVGFLQGSLPQSISKNVFTVPSKIQVLTTDETLFPQEVRQRLEKELSVKFSVSVTRDWDRILASMVESPAVDLIFLPSFWASTLAHQDLLSNISDQHGEIRKNISADFVKTSSTEEFYFLPFYWMKTGIRGPKKMLFSEFLTNKEESTLFLLADEDVILRHFQAWKQEGLWPQISQKKILTLQLDQIGPDQIHEGAVEEPLSEDLTEQENQPASAALLIWGAAVPQNSSNKEKALEVLTALMNPDLQKSILLRSPFNSALANVIDEKIPRQKRAPFIRDLQLKNTLILETKDQEAKSKLRHDFNFIL